MSGISRLRSAHLLDAAKDRLDCATDPNAWMARRIAGVLKTQAVEVLLRIRGERERRGQGQ